MPRHARSQDGLTYRELFFAVNGLGPFECCFCEEALQLSEVTVHHVDHDPHNCVAENLAPAHYKCHIRHHKTEWWASGKKPKVHSSEVIPQNERSRIARIGWYPDRSVSQSERMKELWNDPEWADKQRMKLREAWERKKKS